jgi:hypothetical protein
LKEQIKIIKNWKLVKIEIISITIDQDPCLGKANQNHQKLKNCEE